MHRSPDVVPVLPCCPRLSKSLLISGLLSAFLVIILVWPTGLWGQSLQGLGAGDRIRVTPIEGPSQKGSYQGLTPEGISLRDALNDPYTFPVRSLRAVEMFSGRKRGKGALIGGGVGLVAGILLGAATSGDCVGDCNDPYGVGGDGLPEAAAKGTGALLGGLILGGVGAGVGAMFFAPERWVAIDLDPAGRVASMVRLRR